MTTRGQVTVWSTKGCVQCTATYQAFDAAGIRYEVEEITEHPEKVDELKAMGHAQLPVVTTEADSWAGFRPDKIAEHATAVSAR